MSSYRESGAPLVYNHAARAATARPMVPIMHPTLDTGAARTISSGQTIYMKVFFPVFWIGIFGAGTVGIFIASSRDPTDVFATMKWLFLAAWLLGSAFIYWRCAGLKRVRMDNEALYVSNYREETRVPLHDVSAVSESRWINPPHVIIDFCRDTEFGSRIVFMPTARWFGAWRAHPVVTEIRVAAHHAGAPLSTSTDALDKKSVWSRRIKIALLVIVSVVVFCILLLTLINGILKSSEVYKLSLARAQEADAVTQYIGRPLRQGRFISGSLNESAGGTGDAVLSIPIAGPKGSGTLHVKANRLSGKWTLETMQLEVSGQESEFNLLAP
jgi:hypothetical protein